MMHSPHLMPSSWPRTTATTREERTATENIFNDIGRAISDRQLLGNYLRIVQIGNSYRQRVTLHVHKNLYHAYQSKVHK